jgi:hypothetical protein
MNVTTNVGPARPIDMLLVRRLPARLSVDQTATLLGFAFHDIPILMRCKLLHPLDKPAPNAPKWFAAYEIEELRANRKWLDSATKAVGEHWKHKRFRCRKAPRSPSSAPVNTHQEPGSTFS